ncbi:MAG: hypothetical protein NZM37_12370 [Sandaracinaceae bacterium]|nr:hypothetical protein [Sandaracinaceae bacterium]
MYGRGAAPFSEPETTEGGTMNTRKTQLAVYGIIEQPQSGRTLWLRVGTAFRNRDGSLNAVLYATPTGGVIHIRPLRLKEGEEMPSGEQRFKASNTESAEAAGTSLSSQTIQPREGEQGGPSDKASTRRRSLGARDWSSPQATAGHSSASA